MTRAESEDRRAEDLRVLLEYLKQSRGFDFSGYKRTSLERRIEKRMAEVETPDYAAYLDYLEANPSEFTDLFNTILINVTAFFRDKPAWDYLAEEIIPDLIENSPHDQPIRVWSAACASGEEAYTAAILLAEQLGAEEFQRRVKIYATDVDEDALTTARAATYSNEQLKPVPPELVDKYFEDTPIGRTFRADLRRSVIFGRNDLVQDAPISRIDLLVSRNALMYFTPETQSRILAHFNFALNDTGYLFLGKSEMLITHTELFTPHNLKWRVFRKVPREHLRERLSFVIGDGNHGGLDAEARSGELRADALEVGPIAQVVVDRSGFVTLINQRARTIFNLGPADVGRPLQDLELSYRPVDLRSALQKATDTRQVVKLGRTTWMAPGGGELVLSIDVTPIVGGGNAVLGASIHFDDVTDFARLDDEHTRQKRQLELAYEELQSTVEELETTNEELQSTNEELETTNEELQSTNEELETMNEELQSTNDELETMNDEQRERAGELDRVNMFLEGILGNLGVGVVVVDQEHRVQIWNASSTELWGLRPDEVEGQLLHTLDLGLPVEDLNSPIRDALSTRAESSELTVDAINRRGRPVSLNIKVMPLMAGGDQNFGALILMTPQDSPAAPSA
jgi:two-component system, chemotaxis family, CheB/CheR fusion protein